MQWQPHEPTAVGDLGRQEGGRDEMTFRKPQISVVTQERDWKWAVRWTRSQPQKQNPNMHEQVTTPILQGIN